MATAKRRRLDSDSMETDDMDASISDLLSLNDHCILQIFECLELETLCIVNRTCKRLRNLVRSFFQQKYHNKMMSEVSIHVTFDGRIILSPAEAYVKCFLNYMQNITFSGGYQKRPLDVSAFIDKNCRKNMRQIAFEEIKFNHYHGALIVDWLKTIENVASFSCENIHRILKYCGKVKNLKVDKYSKDGLNKWMTKQYLPLEHLQCDMLRDRLSNDKLIVFLKNNPNVKNLMLQYDVSNQRVAEQTILQLHAIEELLLTVPRVTSIGNEFLQFCERSSVKRLQLCFENGVSHYGNEHKILNRLKCLEGLHLLNNTLLPDNMVLEHLKILHLEDVSRDVSTDIISKNLPNLEELYVMQLMPYLKEFVAPFVRNAVQLKMIVARDFKMQNRIEMTNYRLAKYFNDERGLLADPCKVIIYIWKDEFDASFDTMPSKFDLVEIRQVEFQSKKVSFAKPYLYNFE